jgi:hypothetical protein
MSTAQHGGLKGSDLGVVQDRRHDDVPHRSRKMVARAIDALDPMISRIGGSSRIWLGRCD